MDFLTGFFAGIGFVGMVVSFPVVAWKIIKGRKRGKWGFVFVLSLLLFLGGILLSPSKTDNIALAKKVFTWEQGVTIKEKMEQVFNDSVEVVKNLYQKAKNRI